jgi:hypothetical protein
MSDADTLTTSNTGTVSTVGTSLASLFQFVANLDMGRAAVAQGKRQKAAADLSAWQTDQQANLSIATGQRKALEDERLGRLAESRIIALAAASGGGAMDPTIMHLVATNAGITAYRKNVDLYEGEDRARTLRMQSIASRTGGAQAVEAGADAQMGYSLAAAGAAAKGFGSLYARYGGGGPRGGDASQGDPQLLSGPLSEQ